MATKTAAGLVAHARQQLGLRYGYAFYGNEPTVEYVNWSAGKYQDMWQNSRAQKAREIIAYGKAGPRWYDCAGLVKSYWMQDGPTSTAKYIEKYDKSADGLFRSCSTAGEIGLMPDEPGLLVFMIDQKKKIMHHVGIYAGGGMVTEARGFDYGVVEMPLKERPWTHWGRLSWLAYPDTAAPSKPAAGPQKDNTGMTAEQSAFIERVGKLAQAGQAKHGVLASLTIAQAILESGWGKSGLTKKANALFGIKAGKSWGGPKVNSKTFEYYDGETRTDTVDAFRAYGSWEASIADHGAFLRGLSRYAAVIGETDYKKACAAIHKAGYATEPEYAKKLIQIIERYGLTKFDGTPKPAGITAVAKEVIDGKWGNGEDRKKRLAAAGHDPAAVQKMVNELLKK